MRYKTISAWTRPHLISGCWCRPERCECCGGVAHRYVDLTQSNTEKMAVFSL